jgi:hypothetical protein
VAVSRADEFVTGYHRTSPEQAAGIMRLGFVGGDVFFSDNPRPDAHNRQFGRSVVEVRADKDYVQNDEHSEGREAWSNAPARSVEFVRAWSDL